jgi:hypothetical protein
MMYSLIVLGWDGEQVFDLHPDTQKRRHNLHRSLSVYLVVVYRDQI